MNANLPNKYRPNVVIPDDTAKRTLDAIANAVKTQKGTEDKSERSPLEQVTVLLQRRPN